MGQNLEADRTHHQEGRSPEDPSEHREADHSHREADQIRRAGNHREAQIRHHREADRIRLEDRIRPLLRLFSPRDPPSV